MPVNFLNKASIPDILPVEMQKIINELKESSNKKNYLKSVYQILIKKYHGYRIKTYTKLPEIFSSDLEKLWSVNGFLHCININFVMRTLLIRSDLFEANDVRVKWTLVWYISPHQYLQVKVDNSWVNMRLYNKLCLV